MPWEYIGARSNVWCFKTNALKLCFYVDFKPLNFSNVYFKKICLCKLQCTVRLHCSEELLICGVIWACCTGAEFSMDALLCFHFSNYPIIFCVLFCKVYVFRQLFKCWSVVSEIRDLLKNNKIHDSQYMKYY